MSDEIKDLWPEIDLAVLSPIAVLKFQASQLREKTQGLLEGNVKPWKAKDGDQVYDFEIIVPALEGYTYALFQAWHKPDFVYPVSVRFEPWIEAAKAPLPLEGWSVHTMLGAAAARGPSGIKTPASPKELLKVLGELLQSNHTRGVLSSLIARINDIKEQQPPVPTVPPATGGIAPGPVEKL